MRIVRRRLVPGETDWELMLGALFAPILLAAGFILTAAVPQLVPPCFFHRATGIPCPACGTFRCFELITEGRPAAAFLSQPLAFSLAAALAVYAVYSIGVVVLKQPRIRVEGLSPAQKRVLAWGAVLLAAANWAYLLIAGR